MLSDQVLACVERLRKLPIEATCAETGDEWVGADAVLRIAADLEAIACSESKPDKQAPPARETVEDSLHNCKGDE